MKAGATLVLHSQNAKIGDVAATYASIKSTCGKCALMNEGCYAQEGRVGITVRMLDKAGATAIQAARAEAELIRENAKRKGAKDRPLRLHGSGDCRTETAARIVANAAAEWPGPVWTYTHAWRAVPRAAWDGVSVLASIERAEDGRAALRTGYAPALVVHEHPSDGRAFMRNGVRWIPCPEQTRGVTCDRCRLCFDADSLKQRRTGIAFAAHGNRASAVKRRLTVLR